MIEVPARVKDALRSGDYRKNYKVAVYKWERQYDPVYSVIEPHGNIDFPVPSEDGYYKIYVNNPNISFQFWRDDWDHEPTTYNSTSTDYISYVECRIKSNDTAFFIYYDHEEYPDAEFIIAKRTNNYGWVKTWEINNNNLVSESVKFDERMCSDSELKFGLCEGTSVEFQYFDIPNIRGCRINVELEVECKNALGSLAWYTIPMGWFEVEECSRQASTGIIKASAYNKLKSKYLDKPQNAELITMLDAAGISGMGMFEIIDTLLDEYKIDKTKSIPVPFLYGNNFPARYDYDEYYVDYHAWGISYAYSQSDQRVYGSRKSSYMLTVNIPMNQEWDYDKYYRIVMTTARILSLMQLYIANIQSNFSDYIYDTNSGTAMLFRQYFFGEYSYSKYFRGYYEITQENGSIIKEYLFPVSTNIDPPVYDTDFITHIDEVCPNGGLRIHIPVAIRDITITGDNPLYPADWNLDSRLTDDDKTDIYSAGRRFYNNAVISNIMRIYYAEGSGGLGSLLLHTSDISSISDDITLRELQSAVFESVCQFGRLDRTTDMFSGIELNNGALYPRDNLYPADNLYPQGNAEAGYPSMYSKLWADEGNVRSFRYLIITYKTTETIEGQTQEVEKTLQRTVNADGTDDYNMSDNWLFKNLVWTAADVGDYADAMVTKMQNIKWFPFEMWCAGLPYLEAGDEIEITMNEGTYKSYVLRRTLNGIQNLQDEMINGTLDIF